MIFITLGTQDKSFERLLKIIDQQIEVGNIKDEVVVQAGYTKYQSKHFKVYDLLNREDFQHYIDKCDILITHGGIGSILNGLKANKKVIAMARLKKYKEHTNDHQLEIINSFSKEGYIIELTDENSEEVFKNISKFKPKPFKSNTKKMELVVEKYIDNLKENKLTEIMMYLFFGFLTTLINILVYALCSKIILKPFLINDACLWISNILAFIISVTFAFITNKNFVFKSFNKSKKETIREAISFFGFRGLSLLFDMGAMYVLVYMLFINDIVSKIIANVIVIILNYIFSKLFIFKKGGK